MDCFACSASCECSIDIAWKWSQPRLLCRAHADQLTFAGEPLFELLRRCDAVEEFGQGSAQNRLLNPAMLEVDGRSIRVWVGSAAGALFPSEDRFGARSCFEWVAFETPAMVDLLHAIRLLIADRDVRVATDDPLALLLAAASRVKPPMADPERGAPAGFSSAVVAWNWQLVIDTLRERVGPGAPDDAATLREWAAQARCPGNALPQPGSEARFAAALVDLSRRRFPQGPAPVAAR